MRSQGSSTHLAEVTKPCLKEQGRGRGVKQCLVDCRWDCQLLAMAADLLVAGGRWQVVSELGTQFQTLNGAASEMAATVSRFRTRRHDETRREIPDSGGQRSPALLYYIIWKTPPRSTLLARTCCCSSCVHSICMCVRAYFDTITSRSAFG